MIRAALWLLVIGFGAKVVWTVLVAIGVPPDLLQLVVRANTLIWGAIAVGYFAYAIGGRGVVWRFGAGAIALLILGLLVGEVAMETNRLSSAVRFGWALLPCLCVGLFMGLDQEVGPLSGRGILLLALMLAVARPILVMNQVATGRSALMRAGALQHFAWTVPTVFVFIALVIATYGLVDSVPGAAFSSREKASADAPSVG